MDLTNKNAIVTAAASPSGLGFAAARMLARCGASLMLTDIDEPAIRQRASKVQAGGLLARSMRHDVTVLSDWDVVVTATVAAFGHLAILVNNAGIAVLKRKEATAQADWQRQIDANLRGVFFGCQVALAQMRARGKGGAIVLLSSVAGLVGIPAAPAYAASKRGVRLLTKAVGVECAHEVIRVNSVHPAVIWTDMQQAAIRDNPERYDAINKASIPMGRMGEADDVAAMISFLVSDAAKYVTGGEFVIDAGLTAQ